jgi:hypothetical protein
MDDGRLTIGPRQSPAAILKSPDLIGTTQDLSRLLVRSISRRFQQLPGFFGPKKRGLRMTDRALGAAAPGEFRVSDFEFRTSSFRFPVSILHPLAGAERSSVVRMDLQTADAQSSARRQPISLCKSTRYPIH